MGLNHYADKHHLAAVGNVVIGFMKRSNTFSYLIDFKAFSDMRFAVVAFQGHEHFSQVGKPSHSQHPSNPLYCTQRLILQPGLNVAMDE